MESEEEIQSGALVPFLKWAGGKRWFVYNYSDRFPREYRTYIEPFLGGGSVFFYLQPQRALLGDINGDLINAYQAIKDDWRGVCNSLKYRQRRHREDACGYYYWLRDRQSSIPLQRATRLIYLNRTCFNGIYRVNLDGQFNVPRGCKDKVVIETDDFEATSRLLQGAELLTADFEVLVDRAQDGDFIFCDPPYTVRHNYNGFRKYNEVLFSWEDQERLAAALSRAARRGAQILCTNANHQSIRDLYAASGFMLETVSRYSRISADSGSRRYCEELIIQGNR